MININTRTEEFSEFDAFVDDKTEKYFKKVGRIKKWIYRRNFHYKVFDKNRISGHVFIETYHGKRYKFNFTYNIISKKGILIKVGK